MEIQNADEESDSDEDQSGTENTGENKLLPCSKRIIHKTEWIGEPILSCDDRIYYHSAKVGKYSFIKIYSIKSNNNNNKIRLRYVFIITVYKNQMFTLLRLPQTTTTTP